MMPSRMGIISYSDFISNVTSMASLGYMLFSKMVINRLVNLTFHPP